MKQALGIIFGFMLAAAGFAQTAPVPSQYQDLYNSLSSQISTFDAAVRSNWDGSRSGVIYAPQLEAANSGIYTSLLLPGYYATSVLPELDELQALGAQGVKVEVDFPILYQPFYSANPSLYTSFASFYQQLANDIRARGMKVIVETLAENQNPGVDSAAFTTYYGTLTWDEYMAGRAADAVSIATVMQPDYLALVTQPDAEALYTGQTNAGTVAGSTQLLQSMLTALQSAGITGVSLGAGAGSWTDGSSQYIANFAALPLQYIDIAVYPLNQAYLMNALSMASIAQAAGKGVAMSQLWDYKLSDSEFPVLSLTQTEGRDPFSFWAPIDTAYLQAISDFANYEHALFISPFWTQYFYAYLDYGTFGSLPPGPALTTATAASEYAQQSGSFTSTGLAWLQLSLSSPDTTAPATPAVPVAVGNYSSSAQLTWSATTDNVGVAGYHVLRNGQIVGTTNFLAYSDFGLTPGTTYQYTLTAFDASGNTSMPSPVLTIHTTTNAPPSVPMQLAAQTITSSQVNLTWNASTGAFGVSSYKVYKGSSPNNLSPFATTLGNSYTDTAVNPGVTFYYAVLAIDNKGDYSALSATLGVTPPLEAPPTTPGPPTVYSDAYNLVILTWPASTSSFGVSGYLIFRGATPTSLTQVGNTVFPVFYDGTVTPSTTYYYAVTAYDSNGELSSQSLASSAVVIPLEPAPTAPGNPGASAISYNQVAVSWTAATSVSGIGGYTVYRGNSPTSLTSIGSAPATATTYPDGTAQPSTTYYYAVAAYDTYGLYGPSSSPVSVTTPPGPMLTIAKQHVGSFTQGQQGAQYSVTVSNAAGAGTTSGTVTVTEAVPSGESLVSMSGSGWNCSVSPTCTQSSTLGAGMSYGAITVTVNVAANASSPQVNTATVSGGSAPSANATDSTTIIVEVPVPNVVGDTQAAAATAITGAGLVLGTVTTASSSTVPSGTVISESPVAGTTVAAGTAVNLVVSTGPPKVAVPNVVGDTQAAAATAITGAGLVPGTVTTASSGTVPAGSVISESPVAGTSVVTGSAVNLVVSTGPPTVAVPNVVGDTQGAAATAITGAGLAVGTVSMGYSATVASGNVISESPVAGVVVAVGSAVNLVVSKGPGTPAVVSVTPSPATGLSNTFALTYSDTAGYASLNRVGAIFNPGTGALNSCYVLYSPALNLVYLLNNAGTGSTTITPGSGTLSNSQCTISGSGTTVAKSGNNLTLNLAVTAGSTYTGKQSIYMFAEDEGATNTGWVNKATWTPAANQAPTVVSATPNPATGLSNTFALTYSDPNGASDLGVLEADFGSAVSATNSCFVLYFPVTNSLELLTNAGAASSKITPGSGTLSNSQCTISGSGTTVARSGDTLTLHLEVTASSTYTGQQNIYMFAEDNSAASTGYVSAGTWTPAVNQAPTLVSATPNPATGFTNTFALTYSDPNGASDLAVLEVDFGSAVSATNSCFVLYYPATNSLELLTNAGAASAKITPGSGTLSNSQCSISGSGTTVTRSGDTLTINLAVTASAAYSGKQNIYMFAEDNSAAKTGYVNEGTWTP